MTTPSHDFDDLENDIGNLAVLVDTITSAALDIADPNDDLKRVQALLWIARDLSERLVDAAAACHSQIIAERKMGGAQS